MKRWLFVWLMLFGVISTTLAQPDPIVLPHETTALRVSWSATRLLTADIHRLYLWDATTGKALGEVDAGEKFVSYTGFHPDGTRFFWSDDEVVHIVDAATLAEIVRLDVPRASPEWNGDGTRLITRFIRYINGDPFDQEQGVMIWDTATWQVTLTYLVPHRGIEVKLNRDESRLLVRYGTETDIYRLALLDMASGEVIAEPGDTVDGEIYALWNEDEQFIMTALNADHKTHIYLWDGMTGAPVREFVLADERLIVWSDATTLAALRIENNQLDMLLLDTTTGKTVERLPLYQADLSPDGMKALFMNDARNGYELFNTADSRRILNIPMPLEQPGSLPRPFWSPDSQRFAFIVGTRVQVHEAADSAVVTILRSNELRPDGIYWRPDGKALVVDYVESMTMHLWTDF